MFILELIKSQYKLLTESIKIDDDNSKITYTCEILMLLSCLTFLIPSIIFYIKKWDFYKFIHYYIIEKI